MREKWKNMSSDSERDMFQKYFSKNLANKNNCITIGNNPILKKCKSSSNNIDFYSYMLNDERLAMSWNYNVDEIKQILFDLFNSDIELSDEGKKYFSNKGNDIDKKKLENGDLNELIKYDKLKLLNGYFIKEFIINQYSYMPDAVINYSGNLKNFKTDYNFHDKKFKVCSIENKLSLPNKRYKKQQDKSNARRELKSKVVEKYMYDIIEQKDYDKYFIRLPILINNIITNVLKTFFKKMKFKDEDNISINGSFDLFYFKQLSDAFPEFHRNNMKKIIKNRINIYIETSGYNKVDIQFSDKNNNIIVPELIKIIDTKKTNVVWWNDSKTQHRSPVLLQNDNLPRSFLFLEFNYNKLKDVNDKNDENDVNYNSNATIFNNQFASKKYLGIKNK